MAFEVLNLPAAGLLLLLCLFTQSIPLIASTEQSYQQYLNALPAFAGILELQERGEAAVELKAAHEEEIELRRSIRLSNVSSAWAQQTLRDLDLPIEVGKTAATVGPSAPAKARPPI